MARPGREFEQADDRHEGNDRHEPDQIRVTPLRFEGEPENAEAGDAGNSIVPAETLQVPEHEIKADAPGDRADDEIMAGQAQRQQTEDERRQRRETDRDRQR